MKIFREKKIVTTSLYTLTVPSGNQLIVYNAGTADIYIDIDQAIDKARSFVLQAGLSLTLNINATTVYMQTESGSATIYTLVVENQ